jgi:hypothetical protein
MTYEIYPPTLAAAICTQALRTGRCGELLNELSAGGAATLDPSGHLSIVNGELDRATAALGGRAGR